MIALAALVLALPPLQDPAPRPLVGTWEGSIGGTVRTVVHLARDEEGGLAGTVDSPDQGAFGFALADVVASEDELSFRVPDTHGSWTGRHDAEHDRLVGEWVQRGSRLELVLERARPDPLVGTWQGTADFGGMKLRIVFHVGTRSDGSLGANLVSPDQSSARVPVASVEVREDGTLVLDVPQIGARYEGRTDADLARIDGHLVQSGLEFPLDLEHGGPPPALRRPQTPEPPFPYRVEEVSYTNPEAGNRLAGTLTLPEGDGPFPAVLLISGSGQQDRNEEIFGHRPFLVLADHLTRAGIVVLRVDDRGVGGSTGDVAGATSLDFASDVSAGLDWLKARDGIRPDALGLVGHSEGGLIAPLVAVERDDVAFLVLLAGPGIPGDELLYRQAELLARAGGAGDAAVVANRAMQEELFAVLRGDEEDPGRLRDALRIVLVATLGEKAAAAQLDQIASPWFRFFVNHDPATTLRAVRCPVLALNGEKDLQVPAAVNLEAIGAALEAGGNEDFTTKAYPGLNHLFQPCETGAVVEYGRIEETLAVEVLEDVEEWILERVGG